MLRQLAQFFFVRGYDSSSPKLAVEPQTLGAGSQNVIITGMGKTRIFRGFAAIAERIGAKIGMIVGDSYGGLGFMSDQTAIGSIFRVLGAVFFIGAGKLMFNGRDTGSEANTTLKLRKVQVSPEGELELDEEEFQAGLPQPDAPIITAVDPPAGYTGKNDGTVSVQIARVRSATGARSIASLTSNVVVCKKQSVAIQFPAADLNGQDYWEVDVTLNGYGGIGNHYYLAELAESVFDYDETLPGIITATAKTVTGSEEIGVPNGTFTSDHIGWLLQAPQVETATIGSGATSDGNMLVVVAAKALAAPVSVFVPMTTAENTADLVAAKLRTALNGNAALTAAFTIGGTGPDVVLTTKNAAPTDTTLNIYIEGVLAGVPNIASSTNTFPGITGYIVSIGGDGSYTAGGAVNHQKITLNGPVTIGGDRPITALRGINGVARTYVFEWLDADLAGSDLAPTRDYPPPAGTHGGVSGDVVFVDGCYGENTNIVTQTSDITGAAPGTAIAVSEPARPESFPPDNYIFTADTPVAILEGGQGLHWRFGRNSLGVIRYVGGSPALSYELLWSGAGIVSQNNATLGAGGRLYAYTGKQGAVRLGPNGEPDISFAARVFDDFQDWDPAKVVLGYDANYGYVLFAHERTILCYYEALDVWCAPIVIPDVNVPDGSIKTMVTANSSVYLGISVDDEDEDSDILIYAFDRPEAGGTVGKFVTQWSPSVTEFDVISRIKLALRTDAASTVATRVYTNGSSTASQLLTTRVPEAGFSVPTTLRPNVRNARLWRIESSWKSNGGDAGVEGIMVEGESSGITI